MTTDTTDIEQRARELIARALVEINAAVTKPHIFDIADRIRNGAPMGSVGLDGATALHAVVAAFRSADREQPSAPEPVACSTCSGRGQVGGHLGQTPESFDYVTEPCPDCAAPPVPRSDDAAPRESTVPPGYTLVENGSLQVLEQRARVMSSLRNEEVWYWQGDGHDFPESIACPVVMSADTLRGMLAAATAPREAAQEPVAHIYTEGSRTQLVEWKDGVRDLNDGDHMLYTRPAPQQRESAPSPSYDALLLIAHSVSGALARAGMTDCDDPGEAIDVIRESYEKRIAAAEDVLRELLTERNHYTGGDLFELADRCRHLSRGDAFLIAHPAPLRPVTDEDVRAALEARNATFDDNGGDAMRGMRAALECDRKRLAGEGA